MATRKKMKAVNRKNVATKEELAQLAGKHAVYAGVLYALEDIATAGDETLAVLGDLLRQLAFFRDCVSKLEHDVATDSRVDSELRTAALNALYAMASAQSPLGQLRDILERGATVVGVRPSVVADTDTVRIPSTIVKWLGKTIARLDEMDVPVTAPALGRVGKTRSPRRGGVAKKKFVSRKKAGGR